MIERWKHEEVDKLRDLYPTTKVNDLINFFPGRSIKALQRKAKQQNIKKSKEFWERHLSDIFVKRIEKAKISTFDSLNNNEKAYWLGFIYADGYVYNGRASGLRIGLSIKDKEHLEKIKNILPNPLENIRKNGKIINYTWSSRHLANSLNVLGVFQNKSFDLKFPKRIEEGYLKSFILGFFDGDGCVYISEKYRKCGFSVCGTMEFLTTLSEIILKETGVCTTIYKHGKIFKLDTKDRSNIVKIYEWLYKDENIYLERKKEKFERVKFINMQQNIIGKHVIADFAECQVDFMDDIEIVRHHMIEAVKRANATIIAEEFHKFSPVGISGTIILSESNLCVHIWKDENYMAIDCFTCGEHTDPKKAILYLKEIFKPKKEKIEFLKRGVHWAWKSKVGKMERVSFVR